jgi:hypothetical protein
MYFSLLLLLFFGQPPKMPVYNRQAYEKELRKAFFQDDFWEILTYPNSGQGYFQSRAEAKKTVSLIPIPVVEPTGSATGYTLKKDRIKAFVLKSGQLIAIVDFERDKSAWHGGYEEILPTSSKLYASYLLGKDNFYYACSRMMCSYMLIKNDREYRWNNDTKSFE